MTLHSAMERARTLSGEAGWHIGKGIRWGVGHLSSAPCSTLAAGSCSIPVPTFILGDSCSRGPPRFQQPSLPPTSHTLFHGRLWTFPSSATAPPRNHVGCNLLPLQPAGVVAPILTLLDLSRPLFSWASLCSFPSLEPTFPTLQASSC